MKKSNDFEKLGKALFAERGPVATALAPYSHNRQSFCRNKQYQTEIAILQVHQVKILLAS